MREAKKKRELEERETDKEKEREGEREGERDTLRDIFFSGRSSEQRRKELWITKKCNTSHRGIPIHAKHVL